MSDEAQDTFNQWRIYIIKTLEKLSTDVESLKTLTHNRGEYIQRFERVEKDLDELREGVKALKELSTVSNAKLSIFAGIAGLVGSGVTLGIINWFLDKTL